MPVELVHAPKLPRLRFSRLKLMDRSAAHYEYGKIEEKSPMRKGTALHAYLLGQKDRVVIYKGGARNEKFAKYQEFLAENKGKTILIPSETVDVEGMRRSIEKHPEAMRLLDGIQEQMITWTMNGRECQAQPDVIHLRSDHKVVVELKSVFTAKPELLKWHARKMAYHAQVDWYGNGADQAMSYPASLPTEEHYIVAVESSPPYPVTILHVCGSMLEKGRRMWRSWFEKALVCEESGHFPGYAQSILDWEDEEPESDPLDWEDDDEEAA